MHTPFKRRLRLARRGAWYLLALTLVGTALVVGVLSQALPLAERHPDRIAAWLSRNAGQPVAFDRVSTQWTRRGPLLRLDGLRMGAGPDPLEIGNAEVLVSMYAGLFPGRSLTELRLRGLSLTLLRAGDGAWSVQGLPVRAGFDPLDSLQALGELQVINGKLQVLAPDLGWDFHLPQIDLRLRVNGERVRVGARAKSGSAGAPINVAFDFNRSSGAGRGYLEASRLDLASWGALPGIGGVTAASGSGRVQAWTQLQANRLVSVTSHLTLKDLQLRGAPLADMKDLPGVGFEEVDARLRWRTTDTGWRLDAPRLRMGSQANAQVLDGLVLAGGREYALLADEIDAAPLLAVAALSDRLQPQLRQWMLQAKPGVKLAGVAAAGRSNGPLHAEGRIEQVTFLPVGNSPGLSGLAGKFTGDAEGFVLRLDPATPLRFDWPGGFPVVHEVTLDGELAGWREGPGLQVGSSGLRVRGKDFGAHARGVLWFQGDGTRPHMDMAAQIDDAPVTVAKEFWVQGRMPPAAIDWLDKALLGGTVRDGRAIVSGDLDDWPFLRQDGRFEASARIEDGRIKFQEEWPPLDQLRAGITFLGNGFSLSGEGGLAGVKVDQIEAAIPDFSQAELDVEATGGGDAGKLLALLRQSPLQQAYGETLQSLSASGPAQASYALFLPLHQQPAGERRMQGTVTLRNTRLADKRWNLAFDRVSGVADFNDSGFTADQLTVTRQGQSGLLGLRAGSGVRNKAQAFEAELSMTLAASDLLDRAPEMAWLKPYVEGRSLWTVGVGVPTGSGAATPSLLQMRSNLVGTALLLPAPLDKPAAAALPTTVQTAMPLGSGQVELAFGKLLALRARSSGQQTGVRVVLGADRVTETPPASGLVATGHSANLDAIEWIALARSGSGEGKLPLRHVDITSERLLLLGSLFPDTRLQVAPTSNAMAVTVGGPALAGSLMVPNAPQAAIAGKFTRLYWRAAPTASAGSVDGGDPVNPANVPPLALDVADLHFGEARLGSAELRTQPMANGMRIQQLTLRSPKQRIDLQGEWTGQGKAARTQLVADIDTQDLGDLLDDLGMPGHVDGGKGKVRFDAAWAGSPAAFSLAEVEGSLQVALRGGQLLEVEPGAGRVLGLLSLAQLPRRMLLDFRDFFLKGFAFNRIDGRVEFGGGSARSEDLVMDGPAAEIRISGSSDLRAQQFDQTIEVFPKSGNMLAVVGAVAGGPVGAAIGAAANAVLRKPLGELGAKTYRVTGPWKDPKVEVISREQSRVEEAAASQESGLP